MIGLESIECTKPIKKPESSYRNQASSILGGEVEYYIRGKRVDIVTDTHAIEVDRAYKYHEAIGQALDYGYLTGKIPGIVLIVLNKKDENYLNQLYNVIRYWDITIDIWIIDGNGIIERIK
jgi:hypothetical protein